MVLLSACSTLPPAIEQIPENNLKLHNVIFNGINSFIGQQVRWGGKIISVNTNGEHSILEIKQLPLIQYGFPLQNLPSAGVFVGKSGYDYDPALYQADLLVTFSGVITSKQTIRIADKEYDVPVIDIKAMHLWPYGINDGKAYSYAGSESRYRGYGEYGSGHYVTY